MTNQEELTLIGSNLNYSSWTLRSWLPLKLAGLKFEFVENPVKVYYDGSFKKQVLADSTALGGYGKIPLLKVKHEGTEIIIWETSAILEFIHERYGGIYHDDWKIRAIQRSVVGEMHASYENLREECPSNMLYKTKKTDLSAKAKIEIERITKLWTELLQLYKGKFLFGDTLSGPDLFFAPVVARFNTYEVDLNKECSAYVENILAHPLMIEAIAISKVAEGFVPGLGYPSQEV